MFSAVVSLNRMQRCALVAATAMSSTHIHTSVAHAQAQPLQKEKEALNVLLGPESRTILANYLDKKHAIKSPADRVRDEQQALGREVVIKADLCEVDAYIYRPLFGERAAFRLKGLITTAEGDVVGFGRVTNLMGELFDEDYEASILLETSVPVTEAGRKKRESLIDLPTRIYQTQSSETIGEKWTGRVSAGSVLGTQYKALPGVTVQNLSKEDQIVLDGRICSTLYSDPETGMCSFDRSTISDEDAAPAALLIKEERVSHTAKTHANLADLQFRRNAQQIQEEPPVAVTVAGAAELAEPVEKCPVCRYMKAGPCKLEFVAWDTCINGLKEDEDVKVCYEATAQMMACMQGYEYYDPMTSNSQKY